eukprot:3354256-Pyramimonas_sp.AAC.1
MTAVLRDWVFEWKADSLEVGYVGFSERCPPIVVQVESQRVEFKVVERMNVLGNDVRSTYREARCDLARRICSATRAFYANVRYCRARAVPWQGKCKEYISLVQSVLLYGCQGITRDGKSLRSLWVFEGWCLQRMMAVSEPSDQTWGISMPAHLRKARERFREAGFRGAVQR